MELIPVQPPPKEVKQESLLNIATSGKPLPESIDFNTLTPEQQFQLLTNPFTFDQGTVIKSSEPEK